MKNNVGINFDEALLENSNINAWSVNDSLKEINDVNYKIHGNTRVTWFLQAVSCIDLTTLAADDTRSNVIRLCRKALNPISPFVLKELKFTPEDGKAFTTAAVCVYPAKVSDAALLLKNVDATKSIPIAAVATGFPSGQYNITSRLSEIKQAIQDGATEIDVVIDRSLVLTGQWKLLYKEIKMMKEECGEVHMKTILATGELYSFENIYKASMVAMMAGSDFIKTSTGKETVNARLSHGLVMMQAIRDYYRFTGIKVGFKAAGGIRTSQDALKWLYLVKRELGGGWFTKSYFRIGASGLLTDLEKELFFLAYGSFLLRLKKKQDIMLVSTTIFVFLLESVTGLVSRISV